MKKLFKNTILAIKNRGKHVNIHRSANVGLGSSFEGQNVIGKGCCFSGSLGYGSYIGAGSTVFGQVGKFCSIAKNVNVVSGFHPTDTFVSTHPAFFSLFKQNGETYVKQQKFNEIRYANDKKKYLVSIGNDVWICSGATLLAGVTIGDGAVIAANATVTQDVPPYTVVGGLPAKEVKKRFTQEQIDFLLAFRWYEKPIAWIKENADYFENIEVFMEKMEG